MAVANGQAAGLSRGGITAVICTGYGVMTLTLDSQGNPVGPHYPCPKCLAGLAAYLAPGPVAIRPIALSGAKIVGLDQRRLPRAATLLTTRARGPPLRG